MTSSAPQGGPTRLDDPLPSDVEAGGLSRFANYQRYPAFTWPWFLRRAAVFWPFAIAYGMFMGVWHASSMSTWHDAWPLGWRASVAAIVAVSAGPLAAMMIRYQRLAYPVERVLVIAAVLVGLLVGAVAGDWASDYHSMLMARHSGMRMNAPGAVQDVSRLLGHMMGQAPRWIGLFLIAGGLELSSYVTERRRLAERQRRRDLDALRRDKADTDLRLAVLQAQIEPHFLFNTLASVSALVATAPDRAVATIDALSDYLRSTLPRLRQGVGVHSATLGEQADICARYLELMNVRMGGRIEAVADIPPELAEVGFPPLLLISLVENAVKHGIEPKAGPGLVALRARMRADGQLEVTVEDNGAGLREGAGTGVGLANVRTQLQHRFGARASLEVTGRAEGGVCARLILPAEST